MSYPHESLPASMGMLLRNLLFWISCLIASVGFCIFVVAPFIKIKIRQAPLLTALSGVSNPFACLIAGLLGIVLPIIYRLTGRKDGSGT